MFDHFGFIVQDLEASRRFYEAVIGPLPIKVIEQHPGAFLLGPDDDSQLPFIYIGSSRPTFWTDASRAGASPLHWAFKAKDRAAVDAFHAAGLAAGGRDNGASGVRQEGYYAAFLIDPDGNNIEAGVREAS
jgi:catechol 2,3-dioxygenase-like lactoylglutathione lyase family enzyme